MTQNETVEEEPKIIFRAYDISLIDPAADQEVRTRVAVTHTNVLYDFRNRPLQTSNCVLEYNVIPYTYGIDYEYDQIDFVPNHDWGKGLTEVYNFRVPLSKTYQLSRGSLYGDVDCSIIVHVLAAP